MPYDYEKHKPRIFSHNKIRYNSKRVSTVIYLQATDTFSIFGHEIHSVFKLCTCVILKMKCAICCGIGDNIFFQLFTTCHFYIFSR